MKFELSFAGGKYTYQYDNGKQTALRYDEPWRDLCGDNLIGALAMELHGYRELCAGLEIPEDVQPGLLADLVSAATDCANGYRYALASVRLKPEDNETLTHLDGILTKLRPVSPEPEGYYEKCRRETAEYHAAKEAREARDGEIIGWATKHGNLIALPLEEIRAAFEDARSMKLD